MLLLDVVVVVVEEDMIVECYFRQQVVVFGTTTRRRWREIERGEQRSRRLFVVSFYDVEGSSRLFLVSAPLLHVVVFWHR